VSAELSTQLLTPERLAWVMDVSDSTITEWVKRRELASFKKGRLRRFEAGEVLAFIARHTVRARTAQPSLPAGLSSGDWERIERLIEHAVAGRRAPGVGREEREAA
jgi:excisionase family DNA binding protein